MPEIRFQIEWCDGTQELCYSPSLVVKQYFSPDCDYELSDFVERSRSALTIASDRVQAKYGRPCGLALGQLQAIEARAAQYAAQYARQPDQSPQPKVRVLRFVE